jgi:hypothetical protein
MTMTIERKRLIRHHLEEASTHLGMVKQLILEGGPSPAYISRLTKVGKFLKQLYTLYGGDPRA